MKSANPIRIFAALLIALASIYALPSSAATLLPLAEACFQAQTGINGMVGTLGAITGGSGGTNGTYTNVPLTGGSGTTATANITVSGGAVTVVVILNPGINYVIADSLSASSGNIGDVSGFSVPVASTSINSSLAGGTATFYVPSTNTFKQTWRNSGGTILNTNPVQLDQNGCALIYGEGVYRQILKDSLGNTVWDQLTASTDITNFSWAGTATGSANAITLTDASFTYSDGQQVGFVASNTNTGAVTISINGGAAANVVKATSSGPKSLTGGEIVSGNQYSVVYNLTAGNFQLVSYPDALSSTFIFIKDFGAVGDGSTDDFNAITAWWSACGASTGNICIIQNGNYYSSQNVVFDFVNNQAYGVNVIGTGQGNGGLTGANFSFAANKHLTIEDTGNVGFFYGVFNNFGVSCNNTAGPCLQLGQESLADALNGFSFNNIFVKNLADVAGSSGLEVNEVASSTFSNLTTSDGCTSGIGNCPSGGDSLKITEGAFDNFTGSYSGAANCIHITNGFNFGLVFSGLDVEVCYNDVVADSQIIPGPEPSGITFLGGQFNFQNHLAISSQPGGQPSYSSGSTLVGNLLTVGGTVTGTWRVGQVLAGVGVDAGNYIASLGTGVGGAGTYNTFNSQTIPITSPQEIDGTTLATGSIIFDNANFSGNAGTTPFDGTVGNMQGILVRDGNFGQSVSTPSFPASLGGDYNTTARRVLVTTNGGSISSLCFGPTAGTCIGSLTTPYSFILNTLDKVTVTYTGSPSWVWQPTE